ncbi:MAG: hypothetical protein PVJ15_02840 [Gammaproteobacteria bacterium]|jgi:hypothetical protein
MTEITSEAEFRRALEGLDAGQQRVVAALFVQHVLPLSTDERIARVTGVAADAEASADELADALRVARAATFDAHTRCGSEGDWSAQAGYFVARAVVAALTPVGQVPGDPAWQAAMASRMAQTSKAIASGDHSAEQESREQFRILSDYLNT